MTFPQTFDENNERVRSQAPVVEITLKMDGNNVLSCDIYIYVWLFGNLYSNPQKDRKVNPSKIVVYMIFRSHFLSYKKQLIHSMTKSGHKLAGGKNSRSTVTVAS